MFDSVCSTFYLAVKKTNISFGDNKGKVENVIFGGKPL